MKNYQQLEQRLRRAYRESEAPFVADSATLRLIERLKTSNYETATATTPANRLALVLKQFAQDEKFSSLEDSKISLAANLSERLQERILQRADAADPLGVLKQAYDSSALQTPSDQLSAELLRRIRRSQPEETPIGDDDNFWLGIWRFALVTAPCVALIFAHSMTIDIVPDYPMDRLFESAGDY